MPSRPKPTLLRTVRAIFVAMCANAAVGLAFLDSDRLSRSRAPRANIVILLLTTPFRPGRTSRLLSCPPNWAVVVLLLRHELLRCLIIPKRATSRDRLR
jgi:hypothetical protein